jgi:anti-sigma B factor antagonist
METVLKQENKKLTVFVSGKVDSTTAPALEKTVLENLDGITELVLDLKDMPYTSSAGLRVFLKIQKAMLKKGKMTVIHICEEVMDIFVLTGFSAFLSIQ